MKIPFVSMSRWDKPRAEVKEAKVERKSRWDIQGAVTVANDSLEVILNNLDSILPSEGYAIVYNQLDYNANVQPMIDEEQEQLTKPYTGLFPLLSKPDEHLSLMELKQKKIAYHLIHLLKGQQHQRKSAAKQLESSNLDILMKQLLVILLQEQLNEQEQLAVLKLIDKLMILHGDKLRLYVNELLVIILPLLVSQDYITRQFGHQCFGNLVKAVGAFILLNRLKQDTAHEDEFMRQCCSKALSVIMCTMGVASSMPFIKAICESTVPDERHTGVRTLYFAAQKLGIAVLPHLSLFVQLLKDRLEDSIPIRTITFLAISQLAESCHPYGIEQFEPILQLVWLNVKQQRGRALIAAFKAVGMIIPLMEDEDAHYYTQQLQPMLQREFQSNDINLSRTVLQVLLKCSQYMVKIDFKLYCTAFWNRKMALDRTMTKLIVETTVVLPVPANELLQVFLTSIKDENEFFRKMTAEGFMQYFKLHSISDCEARMQEQCVDGLLYAFQNQTLEEFTTINAFSFILQELGTLSKPFMPQLQSTILFRLTNKSPKVRQLTAHLVGKVAPILKECQELKSLQNLGVVLYEYLGEDYPDTLAAIIDGLHSIVVSVGIEIMTPPIKDLLPRLTPILRNRHEKVQENCIALVGYIAEHGPDEINPREWMRICFELVELMGAQRKGIRKASTITLGCIAQAIGPQEVLATLINNLKVQERQIRLCTAISVAIISQKCGAYTILAQLLNEYRYPEVNVQNGVLKSIAFIFEYIQEEAHQYINVASTLIEDAMVDRDVVHRQIGCQIIKNLSQNVVGFGKEEQLIHMLNLVWPNLFESSHVAESVFEAIEALALSLGCGLLLEYLLQGLFHPARRIRQVYWKIYNGLYITGQDDMVPYYPIIENEDKHIYKSHIFDYRF